MSDHDDLAQVFASARQTTAKYERNCGCGKVIPAHTKRGLEKLWAHHLATDPRHQ